MANTLTPQDLAVLLAHPALAEHLSPADLRLLASAAALVNPQTGEIANDALLAKLYPGHEHKAATDSLSRLRKRFAAATEAAGLSFVLQVARGAKKMGAAGRSLHFVGQPLLQETRLSALALVGSTLTTGQRAQLGQMPVVLLITVNSRETQALFDRFIGVGRAPAVLAGGYNGLGVHGKFEVIHTLCEMGSSGRGAAIARVSCAIQERKPQFVIGVGVGFGCKPDKQRFGDVLVSKQIYCYESRRVNKRGEFTLRGDRVTASTNLLIDMRNCDNARSRDSSAVWPKLHFGLLLSGEELIDNEHHRNSLVALTGGEAIGGEMEAAGIYAAAADHRCDWLIVKAVSDWGDGNKGGGTPAEEAQDDLRQQKAAANAALVVLAFLTGEPVATDPCEEVKPCAPNVRLDRHLPERIYPVVEQVGERHIPTRGAVVKLMKKRDAAVDDAGIAPLVDASVDAFEHLLSWLTRDDASSLFALLGEYGMGKTVTCQRLAREVNQRHRASTTGQDGREALYFDLRDLTSLKDRVPTINEILAECIARSWRTPSGDPALTSAQVHERVRSGALVIFDGLDEVLVHYDAAPGQAFTRELLSLLPPKEEGQPAPKGRLLLSCRTHFFRSLREQTTHFTGEDRSDKKAETFESMTLLPFTDEQVREYLTRAVPGADVEQLLDLIKSVHNLPELTSRPYTLSLIAEHVPRLEQRRARGELVYGVTLYREMVQSWLERDNGKHHLKPEHKLDLAAHLAAALWRQGQRLVTAPLLETWFGNWLDRKPDVARRYAHITPDKLEEDLRNSTFLVRIDGTDEADSGFRFAHSSMQEFFLAQYLAEAARTERPEDWAMPEPSLETLDFLGQTFAEARDSLSLQHLSGWRHIYRPQVSELILAYAVQADKLGLPIPVLAGMALQGAQLSDRNIGQANRTAGHPLLDLSGAQLAGACLRSTRFDGVSLAGAQITGADARWAEWHNCELRDVNWTSSVLHGSVLRECELAGAAWTEVDGHGMQVLRCNGLVTSQASMLPLGAQLAPMPRVDSQWKDSVALDWLGGHLEEVNSCMFSPDSNRIVSAADDGTLRLWDTRAGECLRVLTGHVGAVYSCAFSSDGVWIVSAGNDSTVRLWDAHTGECLRVLTSDDGPICSCAFSPDGAWIVSAGDNSIIRVWDLRTGECVRTLVGHRRRVRSCAFSPDGAWIVSAGDDGSVQLWGAGTGECLRVMLGHSGFVRSCAFSPDGAWIVSTGDDCTLRLWDARTGECLRVMAGHSETARSCSFSPDGTWIVSCSNDSTLRLWDARTGECLRNMIGNSRWLLACAFSADGAWIISGSDDSTLRLWDARTGEFLRLMVRCGGWLSSCAFSPDGAWFISAGDARKMRLWDVRTGECLRELAVDGGWISSCAFSPDGAWVVSAGGNSAMRLWDVHTGECLRILAGDDELVLFCAFSPDGSKIGVAVDDRTLRLLDARTGERLQVLTDHGETVNSCAFSPDGAWVISACDDHTVRLWDAYTGECLRILLGHGGLVLSCAFSPDGVWIASAGSDGTVRLWEARTGECMRVLNHDGWVYSCAFSPDGLLVVSAGEDFTLRLWDAYTGECLRVLAGHNGLVLSCGFSPDGSKIVSAGADATVRLWDVRTGACTFIAGQSFSGYAAWRPATSSVIEVGGDAWRNLAWFRKNSDGAPARWPAEVFGVLPTPKRLRMQRTENP